MKEVQVIYPRKTSKFDCIYNIYQSFLRAMAPEDNTNINLRDLIKVEEYPLRHILSNDSMQSFGKKMYRHYERRHMFFTNEYDRVHYLSFYNSVETVEKVLAALFHLAYRSFKDLLDCFDLKCDTDFSRNAVVMNELFELDGCSKTEFYMWNKSTYDKYIKSVQDSIYNALSLKNIIEAFLNKFIIEYRREGLYLDERCIDMTKDIDVIQYIRRAFVDPQEFFIWADKQKFKLPKDVYTWLDMKKQQVDEKNIEKQQCTRVLPCIEIHQYAKTQHPNNQCCICKKVNTRLFEEELELEEKKNKLLFNQEKENLLQTVSALRKSQPIGTEEWIVLRVGELGLMGYGYNTTLAKEPDIFFNKVICLG